jgi:hypothetical protein
MSGMPMNMPGMAMGGPGMATGGHGGHAGPAGGLQLLPSWLAIVWLLVFIGVAVAHFRYLLAGEGQRRAWHAAHVLMAVGMAFMYAQSASGELTTPSGLWRAVFVCAAGATGAWVLVQLLYRRAVNVLWPLIALDLAAMVYMWSPSGLSAVITWPAVCYFVAQAGLWAASTYRRYDGRWQLGGGSQFSVSGTGTLSVSISRSQPLICRLPLRPSMVAMTVGMAYMLTAMQLV